MRSRFNSRHVARLVTCAVLATCPIGDDRLQAQEWFPRVDFRLEGAYVTSDDPRFNWIFDFGGAVEVVRGGVGRAVLVAEYEAIAGEQFRRFDVNQGNYLLEGVLLFRMAGLEAGPVWHHVSRHLSDRPKRFPIDWNMIALRVRDATVAGRLEVTWQADARATVTKSFVDYRWEIASESGIGYHFTPRVAATGGGAWRLVGVDDTRGRGSQVEARAEIGLRFQGTAGSAELFVGAERRLDPYPLEFGTASWFLAGMRLSSR